MQEPSAILAINSLDRYITSVITEENELQCSWTTVAPTVLSYSVAYSNAFPVVGAILSSAGNGWPAGGPPVVVVSLVPGTTLFNINRPVTGVALNAIVRQEFTISNANQPTANSLIAQFNDSQPYSHNFTIQSPGALIYGYISKIIVSQIQIQYTIPTVCLDRNDRFVIEFNGGLDQEEVVIPHGFYHPDELAAALAIIINGIPALNALQLIVRFEHRVGFIFTSLNNSIFSFPSPAFLRSSGYTYAQIQNILKCYRLLGMTIQNSETTNVYVQTSFDYPTFLYTPFIDIYSEVLTNYQNVKDTNTSVSKFKGMVARIYVSGTGNVQVTDGNTSLGSAAFSMTSDLNTPKVIRWEPNVAIPSIDFQMYDQYGDYIPGATEGYSTEFQMTLLCIEGS